MDNGEIKERMEELEELYKKTNKQLETLKEQKLRIEGQYSVYKDLLNNDEKELGEIGD